MVGVSREQGSAAEVGVRLSPNKIEYLADRVLLLIQEHPKVHIVSNVETVHKTIGNTIFANMREEDEIETEVDELLRTHKAEIQVMEMDLTDLRRKFKREVAKRRGFAL
jgi:hypothetical protein